MLPNVPKSKKLIYLDHAATTYLDPRVKQAMEPFWSEAYGNPSSLYGKGREARGAISSARQTIAKTINSRAEEIIFTAGGSESVNLAIFGVAREFELKNKRKAHLITTTIEHHSVLRSFEALEQEGWKVSYINVDSEGLIKLNELKGAVRPDTILISVMYANNEIGTIEPVAEIGKWIKAFNVERAQRGFPRILFHTDACQAAGALDLNVAKLGVDLMTLNASKIYGPKQVGTLFVKASTPLRPLIFGGGQEKNLRSGTENVAGVVGLAEALRLVQMDRLKENKRLKKLRDYFLEKIFTNISQVVLNGPDGRGDGIARLPNNINISILGLEGEILLLYLDSYNIAVSTGSACATGSPSPSHVLAALGRSNNYVLGNLRLTLGKQTTQTDLDYVMKVLPGIVSELRQAKSLYSKQEPKYAAKFMAVATIAKRRIQSRIKQTHPQ